VPVKVKVAAPRGKSKSLINRLGHPVVRALVAAVLIICLACFGVFAYFYVKYQKIVDERIRKPIFNNAAKIYAAPDVVRVGDHWTTGEIANSLRHAGYTESGEQGASKIGTYVLTAGLVSVRPGAESFHTADNSSIHITDGKVDRTRPLCPYPQVAKYKGTGSIDDAANFACREP